MHYKINLKSVYILGVLLPILLAIFNGYIAEKDHNSWSYLNLNLISEILFIVGILFCALICYLNYNDQKRSLWYTLSITTGIALAILLNFGHSISNYGF